MKQTKTYRLNSIRFIKTFTLGILILGASLIGGSKLSAQAGEIAFDCNNFANNPTTQTICNISNPPEISSCMDSECDTQSLPAYCWYIKKPGETTFSEILNASSTTYQIINDDLEAGNGTYAFKRCYTCADMCSLDSCSNEVTLNVMPVLEITGDSSVCMDAMLQLSVNAESGTWASSDDNIATVSPTGHVTGVSEGSTTITFTSDSGCTATKEITVLPLPNAPVVGAITAPTCTASGSVKLNGLPSGDWTLTIFPSNGPTSTQMGNGNTATVSLGTGTYTATVTNSASCESPASAEIVIPMVPDVPVITPTGPSSLCLGDSIQLSVNSNGGTWESSMSSVATVSNSGKVVSASSGTTTITYTDSDNCEATKDITVFALPTAPLVTSTTHPTCTTSGSVKLSGLPSGSWLLTITSTTGATIPQSGTGSTTTVTLDPGTYTAKVRRNNPMCTSNSSASFTINPVPINPMIGGSDSVCKGDSIQLSVNTNGGTWKSLNPSVATISTNGKVYGLKQGSSNISYTKNNCSDTITVTVNGLPNVKANASKTSVCDGDSITLSGSGASMHVWNHGVTDGKAFKPNATKTYTVTGTDGNGCKNTDDVSVVVHPKPTINGDSKVCEKDEIPLSSTLPPASSIPWKSEDSKIASVSNDGKVLGKKKGTVSISFTSDKGCSSKKTINVLAKPTIRIPGEPEVCEKSTINLTATTPAGSMAWKTSNKNTANVDQSGRVTGVKAGKVTISYTNNESCTDETVITVKPLPVSPQLSVDNAEICADDSVIYTIVGDRNSIVRYTINGVTGQRRLEDSSISIPSGELNEHQNFVLTEVNLDGCIINSDLASQEVIVNQNPIAAFEVDKGDKFGIFWGDSITLKGDISKSLSSGNPNDLEYNWTITQDNTDGIIKYLEGNSMSANPIVSITKTNSFNVTIKVTDDKDCMQEYSQNLEAIDPNNAFTTVNFTKSEFCINDPIEFTFRCGPPTNGFNRKIEYTLKDGFGNEITRQAEELDGVEQTVSIDSLNTVPTTLHLILRHNHSNMPPDSFIVKETKVEVVDNCCTSYGATIWPKVEISSEQYCKGEEITARIKGIELSKDGDISTDNPEIMFTLKESGNLIDTIAVPLEKIGSPQEAAATFSLDKLMFSPERRTIPLRIDYNFRLSKELCGDLVTDVETDEITVYDLPRISLPDTLRSCINSQNIELGVLNDAISGVQNTYAWSSDNTDITIVDRTKNRAFYTISDDAQAGTKTVTASQKFEVSQGCTTSKDIMLLVSDDAAPYMSQIVRYPGDVFFLESTQYQEKSGTNLCIQWGHTLRNNASNTLIDASQVSTSQYALFGKDLDILPRLTKKSGGEYEAFLWADTWLPVDGTCTAYTEADCMTRSYYNAALPPKGFVRGEDANTAEIYPNPTDGVFTVALSGDWLEQYTIDVVDLTGRSVHTQVVDKETYRIDVPVAIPNLADGMYIIQITNAKGGVKSHKLHVYQK